MKKLVVVVLVSLICTASSWGQPVPPTTTNTHKTIPTVTTIVFSFTPPAPKAVHPNTSKRIARSLLADRGWAAQWPCLEALWQRESGWHNLSRNKSSGTYGIAQMMGERDPEPRQQIRHGLKYIKHRYGNPCQAWSAWKHKGWY